MRQRGLTALELCAVLALITVLALILLPALGPRKEPSRRPSCQNNLKQWGLVMKMYNNEHEGVFPPMQALRRRTRQHLRPPMAAGPSVLRGLSRVSDGCHNLRLQIPISPLAQRHAKRLQEEGVGPSPRLVASGYQYLGWMLDNLKPCAPPAPSPIGPPCRTSNTVPDGNTLCVPVQNGGAAGRRPLDPAHLAAKDAPGRGRAMWDPGRRPLQPERFLTVRQPRARSSFTAFMRALSDSSSPTSTNPALPTWRRASSGSCPTG